MLYMCLNCSLWKSKSFGVKTLLRESCLSHLETCVKSQRFDLRLSTFVEFPLVIFVQVCKTIYWSISLEAEWNFSSMNRKQRGTQKLKITSGIRASQSSLTLGFRFWLVGILYFSTTMRLRFRWLFFIMFCMQKTYENSVSSITCLCLDIIGAYIEWIDIGLANDRFIR